MRPTRCRGWALYIYHSRTCLRVARHPEPDVSTAPPAPPAAEPPVPMTVTAWLIVIMAAIGFAFDIYELLMLPLVLGPAIRELGTVKPADTGFTDYLAFWRSLMFYVPA